MQHSWQPYRRTSRNRCIFSTVRDTLWPSSGKCAVNFLPSRSTSRPRSSISGSAARTSPRVGRRWDACSSSRRWNRSATGCCEILDKGHTLSDVRETLGIVRGAGITLRPSLVPFTPWSTLEDYGELLDFVEEEDLIDAVDPIQLAVRLLVPPGSLLLSHPAMRVHLGPLQRESLSYAWCHPDPRMDLLQREIAACVERTAHEGQDSFAAFQAIRRCHLAACGGKVPESLSTLTAARPGRRLPRLTESWFC